MENDASRPIIGRLTVSFDQLDSTNDLAMRWVAKSKPIEGTVITADFQYSGRGQIGRTWQGSPGKNLAYTVILYPSNLSASDASFALMGLSTGVLRAVRSICPREDLSLKWPNDLYWQGKKLGGMLMQTSLAGSTVQHLMFGIGINVNEDQFDEELLNPVSLLQITGSRSDPDELVRLLNLHLQEAYNAIRDKNWDRIHHEYVQSLYGIDKELTFLNLATDSRFQGRVLGVTRDGRLHLLEGEEHRYFLMHEIKWL